MKKVKEANGIRTYETNWEERTNKYTFNQELIFPRNTYNPWYDDKEFMDIYSKHVRPNTLVDIYRCYELWAISKRLNGYSRINPRGRRLERRVRVCILAENMNSSDSLYLCDTF